MALASPLLIGALLFGPPDERIAPVQPQPGEPAIAPAQIDGERAGSAPSGLPSWDEPGTSPAPSDDPSPGPGEVPPEGPDLAPPTEPGLADWTTPVAPGYVDPAPADPGPKKGWGLVGAAGGVYGGMVLTQLITGLACDDAYCGTRGWPWRVMGLGVIGFAGGGGWVQGKRVAWQRSEAGQPPAKLTGRRAGGWTLFALGVAGMVTDAALYQLCYDGRRGPYFEREGFRYTCSPVISVVTLDLATLASAAGLGLGLSAEAQHRHQRRFDVALSPWGGRGQAGLSVSGRF